MAKVSIARKVKRNPDQLRAASKHICWGMRAFSARLEYVLQLFHRFPNKDIGGVGSAITDSFLLHARRMIEFFYCTSNDVFPDDILAEDFFTTYQVWRNIRPAYPPILDQAKSKLSKLLVHFTYQVTDYSSGKMTWEVSEIYMGVFFALQEFIKNVDQSLLDDDFTYLNIDNPNIVICHPIFDPADKSKYQFACTRDKASGLDILVG